MDILCGMKHLALLLLALMAALFYVTLDRPEAWAGWLHAFAEAGMVGAFADWFAVGHTDTPYRHHSETQE